MKYKSQTGWRATFSAFKRRTFHPLKQNVNVNNIVCLSFIVACNSILAAPTAYLQPRSCGSDSVTLVQPCVGRKHGCNRTLIDFGHHCTGCVSLLNAPLFIAHLPHSDDGISDEDEKDDEGLHKGGDGLLTFLEPGQHLRWEG